MHHDQGAILQAYADGEFSRHHAMELLGVTSYDELASLLSTHARLLSEPVAMGNAEAFATQLKAGDDA